MVTPRIEYIQEKILLGQRLKVWISFVVVFSVATTYGQQVDPIAMKLAGLDSVINQTDSLGLKQGKWLHYDLFFNTFCSAISNKTSDTCYRKLSEGNYSDNKKLGAWTYYNDGGCYIGIKRTEYYYPDGSVTEKKHNNIISTEYSPDSMVVRSMAELTDYTLRVECLEKKHCTIQLEKAVLHTFPFPELHLEQDKIAFGYYNRIVQERFERER